MRLLHTSKLELKEFIDSETPEYAILSHTWDDEEISFQDFYADTQRRRNSWSKIINSCRVVAEQGWEWLWIDTCCINKLSSSELSEAINSMYFWYEEAEICFAYLKDVTASSLADQLPQFRSSRWFTRGWTLQELLAPRYLLFLDSTWHEIGTRSELLEDIAEATRIQTQHLLNHQSCNVAQKLSWAAHRRTTRIEDEAYCLLGLFGINMPLIYGERHKAFRRLQLEIIKESNDETIFAWSCQSALSASLCTNPWEVLTFVLR